AGATFPAPIYQKWIRSFESRSPGMAITYDSVGSELGIQKLEHGDADFAASDFLPSEETQRKLAVRLIATIVGGVVPVYNLPNLPRELRFTPQLLADIFLGKVTRWNDAQIKTLNHDLQLPAEEIVVVHRSDGSGTSYVWTDFLSTTSTEWRSKVGASSAPQWPAGRGANGNEGTARTISQTPFSIGYVELIYALQNHLVYGLIKNAAGNFVQADIDTLTAAAANVQGSVDRGISIVNAAGQNSYPIASFTWLLIPSRMESVPQRERLRAFLDWVLSAGQREAGALGYIALPHALAERERSVVAAMWQK
ncbi:MAG: phosphate ABC transporter substrate-binding protein PstS, partial [Acidobacteriaceae bacterium]|nr:phosphate ABC transporter substrate-binding protein PstS [Acidobacteriaceae bacterium]